MPRVLVICLLILCLQHKARSQADSILALPLEEQLLAISELIDQYKPEDPQRHQVTKILAAGLAKQGRKDLEEMLWSYTCMDSLYLSKDRSTDFELNYLRKKLSHAAKRKWTVAAAECNFRMGLLLFQSQRFSPGMEQMMSSYEYLHRHDWTSPVMESIHLAELGKAYYHFGDYQSCIRFLHESMAAKISPTHRRFPYHGLNTLGLCHLQLANYDSAFYFFKASHDYAAARQDSAWMALTIGNAGNALFKSGRKDEALPYLETDYSQSIRHGMYGSAVNAGSLLATIELQKGNIPKAEKYLAFARAHIDTFLDTRLGYYENLFKYHKLKGEGQLAAQFADSVFMLKQRKDLERDRKVLEQAQMKAAYEEYNVQINQLQQARSRQLLVRNALFVLFLLSAIMAIIWIRSLKAKRRTALQKLKESEIELQQYLRSLLEKNELIQSLRLDLENKDKNAETTVAQSTEIARLIQLNILTEEDWKYFRKLFDTVYPGFLVRLKSKLGDLTPAETRILVLAKLGIAQREMGDMLGISYNSIRMARYRLRKKLNLPEEGTLEELVEHV